MIKQSLTKRNRNGSISFLTGHDMKGYADYDWQKLAKKNSIVAIYMGKKASRFIQGRLIMHGADPKTPISLIENVSKKNQRIFSTTLSELPKCISQYDISGPVLTLYGLAPREASHVTAFIDHPNDIPSEMELA